ncbi:MAG: UDP-N-acetylenolpyruvoylglucosamine reductase [Chlamydiae bacterium]|nr:UDP-N-acetylenolpyruvoylglucosamine reductase [Chlamydiota bacterium]
MKSFQKNQSLAEFSTFGIGGAARFFTKVETIEELQEILTYCHSHKLSFHILGKGSNSLFHDEGFDGLVILNKIQFCEIEGSEVHVGAGFSFSLLGVKTARIGLSGLEFASGIPASVGGAIFMNAGANGAEICDTLQEVIFIDEKGDQKVLERDEFSFSYRYSAFHAMRGAIASARFALTTLDTARKKQLEIVAYRVKTQPYGERSCGCIFRNPEGESAGALIEKCGLKDKKVGGAKVSSLHANFIINTQDASSKDVLALAKYVSKNVKEQTGITLEMELRTIPKTYDL